MVEQDSTKTVFSMRLKRSRLACAMTQKQVADALNLERSTIAFYEAGKTSPSLETLQRLAKMFKVSVDYLLGIDEEDGQPLLRDGGKTGYRSAFSDPVSEFAHLATDEKAFLLAYRQLLPQQKEQVLEMILRLVRSQLPDEAAD